MPRSPVAASPRTRVISIFSTNTSLPNRPSEPLSTMLDFGFLERFMTDSAGLLPRVILHERVDAEGFSGTRKVAVEQLTCTVLSTPREDTLVLLVAEIDSSAAAADLSDYVTHMHVDRDRLELLGGPLTTWLAERLPVGDGFRIGYAHHLILADGELATKLLAEPGDRSALVAELMTYRAAGRGKVAAPKAPEAINDPGQSMIAHGRSLTVAAGWSSTIHNGLVLVATSMISAFAVLRRARLRAFDALQDDLRSAADSLAEAREVHARLATELGEVQLDLSFGVEAYIDSVLIPDSRLDVYRESLHAVAGMDSGLANTSRMVERLGSVVAARSTVLASAEQSLQERRDRMLTTMVAVGSMIAIPPALLLAYFGSSTSDITGERSIFDLSVYWPAYLLAWAPFTGLLVIGWLARRRVRATRQLLPGLGEPAPGTPRRRR
ncbi:hypothetical protein F4553_006816 [Allocatelliglobosispora scoriae]|uniref:Uncharacterized protein n=1 Tax=Allocatelliglobosispora scoriae TaxID=643052 RepID=A0A841C2W7_9ACTN|nr:hypothetical protein [Allocatelliglobosispora scoriae]MBB5873382.1 hypothetical protein [Allocatelliglobosispora scoriae]